MAFLRRTRLLCASASCHFLDGDGQDGQSKSARGALLPYYCTHRNFAHTRASMRARSYKWAGFYIWEFCTGTAHFTTNRVGILKKNKTEKFPRSALKTALLCQCVVVALNFPNRSGVSLFFSFFVVRLVSESGGKVR